SLLPKVYLTGILQRGLCIVRCRIESRNNLTCHYFFEDSRAIAVIAPPEGNHGSNTGSFRAQRRSTFNCPFRRREVIRRKRPRIRGGRDQALRPRDGREAEDSPRNHSEVF